jgi:hypothetical protein
VHDALFVFSTGRCGTQWLAAVLAAALGERAEVVHEPLHSDYAPREMLTAADPARLDPELGDPILEHVAFIEQTLAARSYVECGHPLWSTLPYLLRRLPGRTRVVHLVRHPVPTALSWVTHGAYTPPMAPHLSEKVPLSPFDDGVRLAEYTERWPLLTPYEKALFYWAEVNAFGLSLAASAGVPWLRVRFEELVRGDAYPRLLNFAGAAGAPTPPEDVVDEYRYVTRFWSSPGLIERHPAVLRIAAELGYDPLAFDEAELRRRYLIVKA